MSKLSVMKPIDNIVTTNVEKLKESSEYQKFLDSYNSWEDKIQNGFKAGLLFLVVLIPLIIIGFFTFLNYSAKKDLSLVEDIIKTGNNILATSTGAKSQARQYFGRSLTTKSDFEREISNALPNQGIDATKILIGDFSSEEVDGVNEIRAQLKFNGISSQNLFGLFKAVAVIKKIKIDQINLKKNDQTNLLEGTLSVIHFSTILDEEI